MHSWHTYVYTCIRGTHTYVHAHVAHIRIYMHTHTYIHAYAGSTWNVLHEILLKLIKSEKDADVMRFATGREAACIFVIFIFVFIFIFIFVF